ncbi:putative PH domain containing protein [Blattamonas nauphoetae]|uniref:PH domain containing protein n=1 Tax=Blattamonas nauphoetae TaxID=2049346 RepID=A0ABQ9XP58_9EUKA|nr:putative PH domain containing protein [Blattamonas nauphoetae]
MSKEGWIVKEGGSGIFTNWKKRWAVLDPVTGNLTYYEKQDTSLQPLGVVLIKGSFVTSCDKKTKKKDNVFVVNSAGRTFYAQAESKEDCDSWIDSLQKVASDIEKPAEEEDGPSSAVSDTTSLFAGWLTKEAGSGGKWRKRWFILRPKDLTYYKDKTSTEPQGSIQIKGARVIQHPLQTTDKPYLFYLETTDDKSRTFHLEARNASEYQIWINRLEDAIQREGGGKGDDKDDDKGDNDSSTESDGEGGKSNTPEAREFQESEDAYAAALLQKARSAITSALDGWTYEKQD